MTFFKVSRDARWETVYKDKNGKYEYSISVKAENLKLYTPSDIKESIKETGTSVSLNNIVIEKSCSSFVNDVKKYLIAEFSWFLELNKDHNIFIDGEPLDYSQYIGEHENFNISIPKQEKEFNVDYFRWNGKLNDEFCMCYFLNQKGEIVYECTTKLNKKGDGFWHSIIVKDNFYDNIIIDDIDSPNLFTNQEDKTVQKELEKAINEYLNKRRRPFLHEKANQMIEKSKKERSFPDFGNNRWDNVRRVALENLIREFYEVEPQIFVSLSKYQKKVFFELLNLIMDSNSRDNLFKILDSIVELEDNDRKVFAQILQKTKLKHVIDTLKLVSDRLNTIENLKELVFNHELKANERNNLQTFIENHYWIFGEQYRLVCAEEVKFTEALKRYKYILLGISEDEYINHPDKYKEMDLFLTGCEYINDYPHNLVIEIKNPTTIRKLTDKEYSQIKHYIGVIQSVDSFNSRSSEWTFMLIGQNYDNTVEMEIKDSHSGLVIKRENYELYVKKWSDIINSVEARMHYLSEKLQLERDHLSQNDNLTAVMDEIENNTAVMQDDLIFKNVKG